MSWLVHYLYGKIHPMRPNKIKKVIISHIYLAAVWSSINICRLTNRNRPMSVDQATIAVRILGVNPHAHLQGQRSWMSQHCFVTPLIFWWGLVFPLQKSFTHHAEQHLLCVFLQCTHRYPLRPHMVQRLSSSSTFRTGDVWGIWVVSCFSCPGFWPSKAV